MILPWKAIWDIDKNYMSFQNINQLRLLDTYESARRDW